MMKWVHGLLGLVFLGVVSCDAGDKASRIPSGVAGFVNTGGDAPALDGSLKGWERAPEAEFSQDVNKVKVRGMHDGEHIYIRWEVQKDWETPLVYLFDANRIFTHEKMRDTMSFYLKSTGGDMRLVFAVVTDDSNKPKPILVGMFQGWNKGKPLPVEYWSPVRTYGVGHVEVIEEAKMGYTLEDEKKRLILAARIPVSALNFKGEIPEDFRTRGDFSVTLGGAQKFWWSGNNAFGSTLVTDEPSEAGLYQEGWKQVWFLAPTQE